MSGTKPHVPAAIFSCKRAGLVAGFLLLDAGSRKQYKTGGQKKLGLPIWRECARPMRKMLATEDTENTEKRDKSLLNKE